MRWNTGATIVAGVVLFLGTPSSAQGAVMTIASNDFDSAATWSFSTDVALFDNGADGFFGVTSNAASGFEVISELEGQFLGIRDLDDEGDNGAATVNLVFDSIAVTGFDDVTASFQYQVVDWDASDQIDYEWLVDGVGQGSVTIGGQANLSESSTVVFNASDPLNTLGLSLAITQNGAADFAGLDRF